MLFKDKFVLSYQNIKSNISLEPVIVLFVFCNFLANGAQQNNNILFKKICTDKLSYNVSICSDHQKHPEFHLQVLKETNMYSLYLDFVGILPAILYVLIGGALSDKYGKRKPLILVPLIGGLMTNITYIIIAVFEDAVPLNMFFLTKMWEICGGMPLYYLGVCGYAATKSTKYNRSTNLARFDGVEQFSLLLGVALSPWAFETMGYTGCFIFRAVGNFMSIMYLVFVTPEVTQRKVSDSKLPCIEGKNPNLNHVTDVNEVYFLDHKLLEFRDFFQNYVLIPIKSSLNVLWHSPKRTLLLIQILNCTLYWFAMDEQNILYFYMTRRFEKFTGADFAMFIIAMKIVGIFGLLVVIPVLNKYFKLHETIILVIITVTTAVSILASVFVSKLFPAFYLIRAIGFLRPSTLAIARSLLARTVDNVQEIGRIYAITGFISAILPFASNPSYRFLFDYTAENEPNAILWMAGGFITFTVLFNLYLFSKKEEMK